jgi:ABC-type transport system involved in multi-copper enzyme maturation permease subunit
VIDVALLTLKELMRRRFYAGAAGATAVLVGLTAWGFSRLAQMHPRGEPLTHVEVLGATAVLVMFVAYLFSFLLAMAAVFIAAPAIAGEIDSGVLLPILTRPLRRSSVVFGKAIALALVLAVYTFAAGAAELGAVLAVTGYLPPHPAAALAYLALSAVVMVCFALLLGTRMSTPAAGIVAIVAFIIARLGGIAQSIGIHYGNEAVKHAGTISQLLLPSDAMWQAALYRLEPAATVAGLSAAHVWQGPFFTAAPPPLAMLLWACAWVIAVVAGASRSFTLRDV